MTRNPRKNIEPVLADVRHRGKKYRHPPAKSPPADKLEKLKPHGRVKLESPSAWRGKLKIAGSALAAIALVLFFWWSAERLLIQNSLGKNYSAVRDGLLQALAMQNSSGTPLVAFGPNGQISFSPLFNQFNSAMSGINSLSSAAIDFSNNAGVLNDNWLSDFFGGHGSSLLGTLKSIRKDLETITSLNNQLTSGSFVAASSSDSGQIELESELLRYSSAADGLYSLLNSTSSHVLLVFADPSIALRPAGGGLISYADLTINGGQESGVSVGAFSDAGSQSTQKVLPPPPELGGSGSVWEAGQANWFFDFPTSAEKISSFLLSSKAYSSSSGNFSGVILLNDSAWRQIIATVDPNLLPPSGESAVSASYLNKNLPKIFQELAGLSPAAKQDLSGVIGEGLTGKNIMLYFPDDRLEGLVSWAGTGGGIYSLPYNFNGDYLGIANITPAAAPEGTTLEEHVVLKSQIDSSGMVNDDLTVENIYQNSASAWYHSFRRDLIQVFTSPSSALISASGMSSSVFGDLKQYRSGYAADPDLSAVEQTLAQSSVTGLSEMIESGLKVYDGWLNADVGTAAKLRLSYMGGRVSVASGEKFQFVFDKQSGVNQTLDYLVQAPLGYGWAEAPGNGSVYSYHSSNLAPRTTITLTLIKTG